MAKSVLELAVGTGQWNAGLKKAKSALDNFTQSQGGLQQALGKDSASMQKFVQMMGQMDSTAKTAKGQLNDYKGTIEQLTMQYNRMTDAQKKTVGQDYLQAIDQIKQKYQAVIREIQQVNQSLNDTKLPDMGGGLFGGGRLDGMLQVLGGNLMTKGVTMAASAVTSFVSEIGDAVKQGVELARQGEGIRIAFDRLGRGDILDGLREATHGTVTDLELMKAAVKFNDFKLPVEELGTMLAFAQQKAKDTGQSVDYMVDSIVTGLGRKSLMILDNLGLSANDVKEKMKETGDMTKAVGEIIREQMAKAGDYVETAADRAEQANVSLQNKMEELGRKFAPLEEASNSLWTSMKIGILDIVGGPLTDLLNKLTAAGRMANAYGLMGGNAKVGRMTANLAGASEGNRQSIYQQQQEQFWRYINPREQMIKDIRAWQRGERGDELSSRVGAITEKYGMLDATKIQAEVDAAKKMLADYQKSAQQILKPIKQDIEPNIVDDKGGHSGKGGKGGKTEMEAAIGSIDHQTKNVQELQKAWRAAADDDSRRRIKQEIDEAQYALDLMTGKEKFDPSKVVPIQDLTGRTPTADLSKAAEIKAPETIGIGFITPLKALEDQLKALTEAQAKFGGISEEVWQGYQTQIDEVSGKITRFKKAGVGGADATAESWRGAAQAMQAVGSALQQIEDPSMKIAGLVGQAIANIALGFAQATASDSKLGVFGWISAIAGGMATMLSTISAIHSATGYEQGGIVKGNSFSGDNIPIMANAGEVVLTRAMTNNLAGQLQGTAANIHMTASVKGEDIILSVNNTFKRKGKGELVTWRNR